VQTVTGDTVEVVYLDQGYSGQEMADIAAAGVRAVALNLPRFKQGFELLPWRWVTERSFGWMARFQRLARDYERLPSTVAGLHFMAFACLMLRQLFHA
jgi:transposase